MEAIRTIVNANLLNSVIDLPWKQRDMQVEVIVFPAKEDAKNRQPAGKSLRGSLNRYANPALQYKESQMREIGFLHGEAKVLFHDNWSMTPEELGML
jgi:hypothetical protein